MPKKTSPQLIVTCMSRKLKDAMLSFDGENVKENISSIPDCLERDINFKKLKRFNSKKLKREASPYNTFIGKCMKDKDIKSFGDAPQVMKSCAAEWRKQK